MISTIERYQVRAPIYGYAGTGYENEDFAKWSFNTKVEAEEFLELINKVRGFTKDNVKVESSAYEMWRDLTNGHSYHFTGEPFLVKRTITEELLP